jgi:hypothetical protein
MCKHRHLPIFKQVFQGANIIEMPMCKDNSLRLSVAELGARPSLYSVGRQL